MIKEQHSNKSDELTIKLTNKFSTALLLERSKAFKNEGNLSAAMTDLQYYMASNPSTLEASQANELMKGLVLLKCKESSIASILQTIATNAPVPTTSTSTLDTSSPTTSSPTNSTLNTSKEKDQEKQGKQGNYLRVEAASKLAYLSLQPEHSAAILASIDDVIQLIEDPEISNLILKTLTNISKTCESTNPLITSIGNHMNLFLGLSGTEREKAFDMIATEILKYSKSNQFDMANVTSSIDAIYHECRTTEIQISFARLLKILDNGTIVLHFLLTDLLVILFESENERSESLTVAILSRVFQHIPEPDQPKTSALINQSIIKLLCKNTGYSGLKALSALFQVNILQASSILQKDGVLPGILEAVEFESGRLQLAVVRMLSYACVESKIGKLVVQQADAFLWICARTGDSELKVSAYVTLIKVMGMSSEIERKLVSDDEAVSVLTRGLDGSGIVRLLSVEALSYLSIHGQIKERIIENIDLLASLKTVVNDGLASQYAVSVIISNLTAYPKEMTKEETQVKKLHQMAKSLPENDPFELPALVAARATRLVDLGFIAVLVTLGANSPNTQKAVAQALLSIAINEKNRGRLIQAGACRVLIRICNALSLEGGLIAAQAVAKIAITTDPYLAFKGEMSLEAIRPFVNLIRDGGSLQQFEGLMALTNLAGMDDRVRERILSLDGLALIKELQFSNNMMIRRAATEALCNLIYHPTVFAEFLGGSQMVRIMMALADDDDFGTRRAAAGALAVLSSEPEAIPLICGLERFEEIVIGLVTDESPEIVHRGVEILKNVAGGGRLTHALRSEVVKLRTHRVSVVSDIAMQIN